MTTPRSAAAATTTGVTATPALSTTAQTIQALMPAPTKAQDIKVGMQVLHAHTVQEVTVGVDTVRIKLDTGREMKLGLSDAMTLWTAGTLPAM